MPVMPNLVSFFHLFFACHSHDKQKLVPFLYEPNKDKYKSLDSKHKIFI